MTATDEGKAAFASGKTHRDNPHAGERREDWSEGWRWGDYTHWMPLPAAPKEGE